MKLKFQIIELNIFLHYFIGLGMHSVQRLKTIKSDSYDYKSSQNCLDVQYYYCIHF